LVDSFQPTPPQVSEAVFLYLYFINYTFFSMPKLDFNNAIILENNRTLLTPLKLTDIHVLEKIAYYDTDLLKYSPSEIKTGEKLEKYINSALDAKAAKNRYPFLIYDKKQGAFAGSTSFGNVSNNDLRLEIGWTWIGYQFQKTGLNKAVKQLLLTYAFDTLDFERVELKTDSRNLQSRRAMEKIGATFEGELRSHTLMPDGFRRNTVYYSILKNEWLRLKKTTFKDD
tara:strand:+ start:264743 stop:265423 length:681 start_codon:yes stop_codon:yes gene_type:complete